jgi:hypothetical protein
MRETTMRTKTANKNQDSLTATRVSKTTGRIAAVSALAGATLPDVHAAGSDLIQVALVGCGGRGTGAGINALSTKSGPIKLVAMAEVFADRLQSSLVSLKEHAEVNTQVDVPADRQFVGLDAYKKALDCLKRATWQFSRPHRREKDASAANYAGMSIIAQEYRKQRLAAPHTWHAAEIFLYLLDQKSK